MQLTDLLTFGVKNNASDLHLSAGLPPMIRVNGDIRRINLPDQTSEAVSYTHLRAHETGVYKRQLLL